MTSKPIIHLKGVKVHTGLSEETPAYTAKLFIDGEYFADVSNDGHGGCDRTYAPKGKEKGFQDRWAAMEKLVGETYPATDMSKYDMDPMKETLECLCHGAVWESVDQRNMKSRLSRTIMTMEDVKCYSYKGKKTDERMDAIAKQKPDAIILNRLVFSEAWEISKQAA